MCLSAAEGAAQQSKYSRVGQISGCRLACYVFTHRMFILCTDVKHFIEWRVSRAFKSLN